MLQKYKKSVIDVFQYQVRPIKAMNEDKQLDLLATDGILVKRPLVVADHVILTGLRKLSGMLKCGRVKGRTTEDHRINVKRLKRWLLKEHTLI